MRLLNNILVASASVGLVASYYSPFGGNLAKNEILSFAAGAMFRAGTDVLYNNYNRWGMLGNLLIATSATAIAAQGMNSFVWYHLGDLQFEYGVPENVTEVGVNFAASVVSAAVGYIAGKSFVNDLISQGEQGQELAR